MTEPALPTMTFTNFCARKGSTTLAVNGIDAAGTAYRMDGIPIRTRKFIETGYPTDTELMEKIYDRIRKVKENA